MRLTVLFILSVFVYSSECFRLNRNDDKTLIESNQDLDMAESNVVSNNELIALRRVKRKNKYKIKTHDKVIKIKQHKTKIKIGGGGGLGRTGTGLLFGAGLVGAGAIGYGLGKMSMYEGRYGRYQFDRYGHTLILISNVNVTGFNYSTEHNHYHDIHGHFLAPDGLYYVHGINEFAHDAREHIPFETVGRIEASRGYSIGDQGRSYFRYYPYNTTHGIWEYNAISVSEKVTRDAGRSILANYLTIVSTLLIALFAYESKAI